MNSGLGDARMFEIVGSAVRYARFWAHYTALVVGSGTLLLVYITMFRFGLVPRLLAGVGMICVIPQMTGLMIPFFGGEINFLFLAPIGICHIVLSIWLVVKGFSESGDDKKVVSSD